MIKTDLLTGEKFKALRINQKFANPQNRIDYHNKKANHLRQSLAYINKPLLVNIRILNELMEGKTEAVLHKQFLLGKGFCMAVHTHYEKNQDKFHCAIYQYIIITLENEQIKIIKK